MEAGGAGGIEQCHQAATVLREINVGQALELHHQKCPRKGLGASSMDVSQGANLTLAGSGRGEEAVGLSMAEHDHATRRAIRVGGV
jgi:hypothetical protein